MSLRTTAVTVGMIGFVGGSVVGGFVLKALTGLEESAGAAMTFLALMALAGLGLIGRYACDPALYRKLDKRIVTPPYEAEKLTHGHEEQRKNTTNRYREFTVAW